MCNPDSGFDPNGAGYDYDSARRAGMGPSGANKHWGTVREAAPEEVTRGVPQGSHLMLKGRQHPTWNEGMEGELARGSEIKNIFGRYWSVPKGR